jgi:hypothetical protein
MVDPIVSFMGVESGDFVGHKRFLALFAGGMLPIISLSFLHMLVKFEEEGKKDKTLEINIEELSRKAGKMEAEIEEERYVPSEEDLQKLNEELNKIQQFQEIEPEEIRNKRRLSYLKRDAQT